MILYPFQGMPWQGSQGRRALPKPMVREVDATHLIHCLTAGRIWKLRWSGCLAVSLSLKAFKGAERLVLADVHDLGTCATSSTVARPATASYFSSNANMLCTNRQLSEQTYRFCRANGNTTPHWTDQIAFQCRLCLSYVSCCLLFEGLPTLLVSFCRELN